MNSSLHTPTGAHPIQIVSFYHFLPLTDEQVQAVRKAIHALVERLSSRGLCIMGREGLNATFSVPREHAAEFKSELNKIAGVELQYKDSYADFHPFHEFVLKVRNEIVTLARPDLVPNGGRHRHLSPEEWHKAMNEEDVVVVDTRNSYEYEIGRFKNALDPKTRNFNEFPDWLKTDFTKKLESNGKTKNQKILIYCTGGIRCEKAILEMEEQGFDNVYQLDGGILNYIEKYPKTKPEEKSEVATESRWDGECFVFDYRVAVDGNLQPTTAYRLCPHCGQPGNVRIDCNQCPVESIVCTHCLEKGPEFKTCSKNCLHHFKLGHKTKRLHYEAFKKRRPGVEIKPSANT